MLDEWSVMHTTLALSRMAHLDTTYTNTFKLTCHFIDVLIHNKWTFQGEVSDQIEI